jgi:MFS family permease
MKNQIYSIGAILLSTAIFIAGNGLLGTLIPVRAHLDGFSDLAIGFIGSAYFVGFVAGCFAGPNLLSRVGHIRAFAIGAAIAAATTLLQSLFVTLFVWTLMRALFGFAAANLYMVIESWLNERATNEFRGRIFASYLIVNFSSLIFGQLLFATNAASSFSLFDLCAICYATCLIPVAFTLLPQPERGRTPQLRPFRLYRIAPVGVIGCITVGLANGALWTLAPIYAQSHGLTKGWLAIFMSAFTLGGALVQLPLGRFSDRVDRRTIIAGVCGVSAVLGTLIAVYGGHQRGSTLALMALFGMSALPLYGLTVAHTNDRIAREDFIEASATLLMISSLASVIGPPVAAVITGIAGTASLFLYTAAIHASMALFALYRLRIKDAPASRHHAAFEVIPQQSTPAAGELDPRSSGGDERAAA